MGSCVKKCKREGNICSGCSRTIDDIIEAGRKARLGINEITGDKLVSRPSNKNYEDGYDRIFKKKPGKGVDNANGQSRDDLHDAPCNGLGADEGDSKTP